MGDKSYKVEVASLIDAAKQHGFSVAILVHQGSIAALIPAPDSFVREVVERAEKVGKGAPE